MHYFVINPFTLGCIKVVHTVMLSSLVVRRRVIEYLFLKIGTSNSGVKRRILFLNLAMVSLFFRDISCNPQSSVAWPTPLAACKKRYLVSIKLFFVRKTLFMSWRSFSQILSKNS